MKNSHKILHLHGIGSAGGGSTAEELAKLFKNYEIISPDLPVRPLEAWALIKKLTEENDFYFVTGTSLGGFYAMLIKDLPKFAVNPAMNAPYDIEKAIGIGVQNFVRKRPDGATTYTIDRSFINELQTLYDDYQNDDHDYKSETYGIFGTQDNLLDNLEGFRTKFGETHLLTGDFGHRMPQKFLRNTAYEFICQKLEEFYIDS